MLKLAKNDQYIAWILGAGLLVQIVTSITQLGYLHPDQHFQIIEFSAHQLGEPSGVGNIWEFRDKIRPTIAIYILSGFRLLCNAISITDIFMQLLLVRILIGVASFLLFNTLIIRYFSNSEKVLLYTLLLVSNFSWVFPYTRTMYTSEMLSSIFFFGAIAWLDSTRKSSSSALVSIGGLLAVAFFMRFQIGLAGVGLIIGLLQTLDKKIKKMSLLGLGFAVVVLINIGLDSYFYDTLTITPWRYFSANILEGKAASFGESTFIFYGLVLMLTTFAPPISVVLMCALIYGFLKNPKNIYLLCIISFIIGNSLVGHKEDRFLFPIFGVLPIGIGLGLKAFKNQHYMLYKKWQQTFKILFYISFAIGTLFISILMTIPYSQNITFIKKIDGFFHHIKEPTNVYCVRRTPYETMSLLKLKAYQNIKNPALNYHTIDTKVPFERVTKNPSTRYLCTTYNELKASPDRQIIMKKVKPIFYSSKILWTINDWLDSIGANTIMNIWVLYEIEDLNSHNMASKNNKISVCCQK